MFRPTQHVYASSAQPWDHIGPKLSAFSKIPDAEQVFMRLMELEVSTEPEASNAVKDMFRHETLVTDESVEALLGILCSFGLVTIDEASRVPFAGA